MVAVQGQDIAGDWTILCGEEMHNFRFSTKRILAGKP
jgi:hypothetical protein